MNLDFFEQMAKKHGSEEWSNSAAFQATPWEASHVLYALMRLKRPLVAVELGAHIGCTTMWLARGVAENGRGKVLAYEKDHRRVQELTRTLLEAGVREHVEIIHQDFLAGPLVECDFAFVDIEPKSAYVQAFSKLSVQHEGIVAFHDTRYDARMGNAVKHELLKRGNWEFVDFNNSRGLLIARKAS